MSFNPMDAVKEFINKSADSATQSYNKVSEDVSKAIAPIVQNIKQELKIPNTNNTQPESKIYETKKILEQVNPQQDTTNELSSFEKQFESQYVGCYADDPVNPSMEKFLGTVSNISECINMGKENNFKYVGIRGGEQCYASNSIPATQSVDRKKYCNVGCNDVGTGNCGGFFYNQVYKTFATGNLPKVNNTNKSEQELTSNAINILENFINSDTDMKKITMGLNNDNFNCWQPLNTYVLFFWLIILVFLIYLLFEYIYKKNNEKII